ncbi:hypothetical protein L202_03701 [Cryptococcus amylolentus CBS 6039]|uniref:RING-type domain-containing protein n=1 Tax=Cryptococcus amylolentus CBS 6039 TaxID=1295533 RepID=A0A1E3HTW4_9TREE|nr:hypothetical protein L202_03701 [Cryptococcus amylolentus CBS 6039]ODN79799.1 hypothetical protein L202_03701 [Cryptococcus amylolentus CBS 6039]
MRLLDSKSTFIILGPNPNQCLEITSESSDDSSAYSPSRSLPSTPSRNFMSASSIISPLHRWRSCLSPHGPPPVTPLPTSRTSKTPSPARTGDCDTRADWIKLGVPDLLLDDEVTSQGRKPSTFEEAPQDAEAEDRLVNSEGGSPVILTPVSHGVRQQMRTIDMTQITMFFSQPSVINEECAPMIEPITGSPCDDKHRQPCLEDNSLSHMQADTEEGCECESCGRQVDASRATLIIPCRDVICASCFSSTVAAVSVTKGQSKCPACLDVITTFESMFGKHQARGQLCSKVIAAPQGIVTLTTSTFVTQNGSIVMRIDNVGWDVTPSVVEEFLPKDSLSRKVPQSVHILLDKFDGRTKDYLYIEVASLEAARHILATRQNTFMPGGKLTGHRLRAVTISAVPQKELIDELRPKSNTELHALLTLCRSAVASSEAGCKPSGAGKYIKARHGPFYLLMSMLSKLSGKESPSYSDLFHVTAGAIAALTDAISRRCHYGPTQDISSFDHSTQIHENDEDVRQRLLVLSDRCFHGKQPTIF